MKEGFDLAKELKELPDKPGVYIMHGDRDEIIYIGKAVVLKNRVRQYFQSGRGKSPKIQRMVSKIRWFETIIVDSESEALVLECNLIKEHRPKYNTMMMDDKGYPYLCITNEPFPRLIYAHQQLRDKNEYFGPYTSGTAAKETLLLLQRLFKLRTCRRKLPENIGKERQCLRHHIGQCDAPCAGLISQEEYNKKIEDVKSFLNGRYDGIKKDIKEKMLAASEALEFEEAARLRDLLLAIEHVEEHQKMLKAGSDDDRDIVAIARDGKDAVATVFIVREGRVIGRENIPLAAGEFDEDEDVLTDFLWQFYSGTPYIPSQVFLQADIEAAGEIEEWLSGKKGKKVKLVCPKRGDKEKLVELAEKNAGTVLARDREKLKKEEAMTKGAMKELEALLGLDNLVRCESYDISNISGFASVGSMVVFENGRPKKTDYRKFRIKWVQGINDYASMEEVLTRRFKRAIDKSAGFERMPDIILMDGGRGQVGICEQVLAGLGLEIPVAGLVKDDRHRTRGIIYKDLELPIDTHSEAFKLITRIQDEVHRFAIEYHRSLRSKAQTRSVLEDIPGIGEKRRRQIMMHFAGVDELMKATEEEIAAVPGMNALAAKNVYEFLHK